MMKRGFFGGLGLVSFLVLSGYNLEICNIDETLIKTISTDLQFNYILGK
jgi:hypothetical protein